MKDEIKEILDELESMFEISELEEQVNNINKIRDCITNLQQEIEKTNKLLSIANDEVVSYTNACIDLQQEIKEANDSITWWTNRFKAVERDNRELKEELEEEKRIEEADFKTIQRLEEENENNKKAINLFKDDLANMTYQYAKEKDENERLKEWKEDLLKENIELENIRKEAFEYITNTIIPYGDEWHWDDSSIRDYVVELLSILQNWK